MKHMHSERAFEKYKPHISWRKKLSLFFARKQQKNITPIETGPHYKINPFKQRRAEKRRTGPSIKVLSFFIVASFWLACLLYIPYFHIQKIEYSGLKNNTKQELDSFIYTNYINKKGVLPWGNYFFITESKLTKDLLDNFSFETVVVKKTFPHKISVDVIEKISSVIYDNGKKYFLLDQQGTVIKFLTDVEPTEITKKQNIVLLSTSTTDSVSSTFFSTTSITHTPNIGKITKQFGDYPIIYDSRNIEVEKNSANILPSQYITATIEWYNELSQRGSITPEFFVIDNLNAGATINTDQNWDIFIQPRNNTASQIDTFKKILSSIKPKSYIDLRFGEKVYWK